jgi:hypothetical protein
VAAQLQAALRQIWAKATPVQKLALLGPLNDWLNACVQVAPSSVTLQDKQCTLQAIQKLLVRLPEEEKHLLSS